MRGQVATMPITTTPKTGMNGNLVDRAGAKTAGNYANSLLAKTKASKAGYDEVIMPAPYGLVVECAGENIFVVRNGVILAPMISAGAISRKEPVIAP